MLLRRCFSTSLVVVLSLVAGFGCVGKVREAAERQKESNELKMVGLMYHNYIDQYMDKAPMGVDDLAKVGTDPSEQAVLNDVRSGKISVMWGMSSKDLARLPEGSSRTVLGFSNVARPNGRHVLYADGSVMFVTEAEFESAKKFTPTK